MHNAHVPRCTVCGAVCGAVQCSVRGARCARLCTAPQLRIDGGLLLSRGTEPCPLQAASKQASKQVSNASKLESGQASKQASHAGSMASTELTILQLLCLALFISKDMSRCRVAGEVYVMEWTLEQQVHDSSVDGNSS